MKYHVATAVKRPKGPSGSQLLHDFECSNASADEKNVPPSPERVRDDGGGTLEVGVLCRLVVAEAVVALRLAKAHLVVALLPAAGVSVAAVFVGALAPALRASRLPAVEAMRGVEANLGSSVGRGSGARTASAHRARLQNSRRTLSPPTSREVPVLLARRFRRSGRERGRATVAELALSVALLVGGGILATYQGETIFEGTPADVSAKVSPEGAAAAPGAKSELVYLPALLERLRAQDGIDEAGFVSKTQVSLDLDDNAVADGPTGRSGVLTATSLARSSTSTTPHGRVFARRWAPRRIREVASS